jgi:solute carrier family 36 (proton-coupled amino acid transporter)
MAYSGISVCIPIESSMAKPEQYNTVLHITLVFLTILYCGFGLLAYSFFGSNVNSVITDNLRNDWEAMVAKIGLILLLLFGIPVQLYSVYQIVENSLAPKLQRYNKFTYLVITSIIRIIILLGTVGLAIVVPLFGLFTNLIGALCTTAVTFILPPIFHMRIYHRYHKLSYHYIIISVIIMTIGIGGGGVSSVVTLKKIISQLA